MLLTLNTLLLWGLALVCGLLIVGFLYRRDEKKEDRKRALIDLFGKLEEARMPHLAEIVRDVAVSDWDGLYRDVHGLAKRANEPGALLEMLVENFRWQLGKRLEVPAWREEVEAMLDRYRQASAMAA